MDFADGVRAFVAVVETGSFTAAGRRLGVSNKQAGKHVAALEGRLGRRLLHRTTRSVSLTPDGERWLPFARTALAGLEAAEAALAGHGEGLSGRLRITAGATFGELCLMDAARTFLKEHPGMRVDLVLADAMSDLAAGGFDLAVRISVPRDSSYRMQRVGITTPRIAASPAYLAQHGVPERPEDLADHHAILDLNEERPNRWTFRDGTRDLHLEMEGRLAVNSASATIGQALAGHGLVRAPDIFLAPHLAAGGLVRVLDGFCVGERVIHLLTNPTPFRADAVSAFAAVLRRHLRQLTSMLAH